VEERKLELDDGEPVFITDAPADAPAEETQPKFDPDAVGLCEWDPSWAQADPDPALEALRLVARLATAETRETLEKVGADIGSAVPPWYRSAPSSLVDELRDLLLDVWAARMQMLADAERRDVSVTRIVTEVERVRGDNKALRRANNLLRAMQRTAAPAEAPEAAPDFLAGLHGDDLLRALLQRAAQELRAGKLAGPTAQHLRRVLENNYSPEALSARRKTQKDDSADQRREENFAAVWDGAARRGHLSPEAQSPTADALYVVHHRSGGGNRERKATGNGDATLRFQASAVRLADGVGTATDGKRVKTIGIRLGRLTEAASREDVLRYATEVAEDLAITTDREHSMVHGWRHTGKGRHAPAEVLRRRRQ